MSRIALSSASISYAFRMSARKSERVENYAITYVRTAVGNLDTLMIAEARNRAGAIPCVQMRSGTAFRHLRGTAKT
jgi:hypothetical protein